MASSMIDTLLQAAAPPRATENPRAAEPPRGSDPRTTFGPVLTEALQADRREPASQPVLHEDSDVAENDSVELAEAASAGGEESAAGTDVAFDEAVGGDSSDEEQDVQATTADDELAADDAEDDESDEVEISAAAIAAAEAAALAAAEAATAGIEAEDDADEVHIAPATSASSAAEAGDEAGDATTESAPKQTSEKPARDGEAIEIGDVRIPPSRRPGEAPPDTDPFKAAANAAARPAHGEKEAVGAETSAPKPTRAKTASAPRKQVEAGDDAAAAGDAEASDDASAETDRKKAIHASAAIDGDDADDATSRDAAKQVKTAAVEVSQQADGAAAVVSDATAAPTTTQSEDSDATATSATAAAPVVQPTSGEARSSARSAAALARLSADRSIGGGTGNSDQVDRARFVGRVEGAIRAAQQRDGRVHVRLSPPELGALRIELTMQNGVLSARLEAETPAARNLLLDNLPALRDRLAQQDVRIDRFDVDVRRDGGGASGQQQQQNAQDRQAQDPHWRQSQQRQDRTTTTARATPPARPANLTTDAALDVRV